MIDLPNETRYYIDSINRAWLFDDMDARWWSPELPGTSCSWTGVLAYCLDRHGNGSLREATDVEMVQIEDRAFGETSA